MNSRQRVEICLQHKEPDRVPCDITITADAYQHLCEYLGMEYRPLTWDDWYHAFPSIEVLSSLGVDVYHLRLKTEPAGFSEDALEFRDQWGVLKKKAFRPDGVFMYNMVDHPLEDIDCVDAINDYNWPQPEELINIDGARENAKQLYDNTEFALTATFGGNVFERAHYLRGMDNFFVDLMVNPELAEALMDKILSIQMAVDAIVLSEIGQYLTYFRFCGEDLGMQTGPLISPDIFRRSVKNKLQQEWQNAKKIFHQYNKNGKAAVHSCGAIFDFIPDFIEMGADILNPLQPNAHGMDTKKIKNEFGGSLCFHGAVDSQGVLAGGSVSEVREEVRKRIAELAPGGGYILSPSHNIQTGMSPENIVALYDAVKEFGSYPIKCFE